MHSPHIYDVSEDSREYFEVLSCLQISNFRTSLSNLFYDKKMTGHMFFIHLSSTHWSLIPGEEGPHLARTVEKHTRWFWRFFMCPLLFGIIGTQINFKTLPKSIIPKVVAIIFAGKTGLGLEKFTLFSTDMHLVLTYDILRFFLQWWRRASPFWWHNVNLLG